MQIYLKTKKIKKSRPHKYQRKEWNATAGRYDYVYANIGAMRTKLQALAKQERERLGVDKPAFAEEPKTVPLNKPVTTKPADELDSSIAAVRAKFPIGMNQETTRIIDTKSLKKGDRIFATMRASGFVIEYEVNGIKGGLPILTAVSSMKSWRDRDQKLNLPHATAKKISYLLLPDSPYDPANLNPTGWDWYTADEFNTFFPESQHDIPLDESVMNLDLTQALAAGVKGTPGDARRADQYLRKAFRHVDGDKVKDKKSIIQAARSVAAFNACIEGLDLNAIDLNVGTIRGAGGDVLAQYVGSRSGSRPSQVNIDSHFNTSLWHELTHAIDHQIGMRMGHDNMASTIEDHPLRQFAFLALSMPSQQNYIANSQEHLLPYLTNPAEIIARFGADWVAFRLKVKGYKNPLANVYDNGHEVMLSDYALTEMRFLAPYFESVLKKSAFIIKSKQQAPINKRASVADELAKVDSTIVAKIHEITMLLDKTKQALFNEREKPRINHESVAYYQNTIHELEQSLGIYRYRAFGIHGVGHED